MDLRAARWTFLALGAALALGACRAFRPRSICTFSPSSPPPFVIGDQMPSRFGVSLWLYDDSTPRRSLDVSVKSDGVGSWRVWTPATKVDTASGTFQVPAEQIASVWNALRDSRFDVIDPGEVSPDVCSGGASGIERYAVHTIEAGRYVWRAPDAADVAPLRRAVCAALPPDVVEVVRPDAFHLR